MATFILCFASASIGACLGAVVMACIALGARADRHDDAVAFSPPLRRVPLKLKETMQ